MCPLQENRNQRRKTEINAYYVRLFFVVKKVILQFKAKVYDGFSCERNFSCDRLISCQILKIRDCG